MKDFTAVCPHRAQHLSSYPLSLSLSASLCSFSSFQTGMTVAGKQLWSLGPHTARQISRITSVEAL